MTGWGLGTHTRQLARFERARAPSAWVLCPTLKNNAAGRRAHVSGVERVCAWHSSGRVPADARVGMRRDKGRQLSINPPDEGWWRSHRVGHRAGRDGRGDSGCGQSRLCCDSIRADAQSHTPHPQKGPLTRYARQRPLCRPGAQRWRHMAGITTDRGAHSRGVCLHRQCSPRCNTRDGGLAEHLFVWRKLQYA